MSLSGYQAKNHPQQQLLGGALDNVDDRELPAEDFNRLNDRFHFTLDVAAAAHNAKLDKYYSLKENGLLSPWAGERVYCNPPYSNIAPWVQKAWADRMANVVVMLLPANRTEQRWWQEYIEPYRDRPGSVLQIEFLPGRLRFLKKGQTKIGPNERPPFGSMLAIWCWEIHSPSHLHELF